MVISDEWKRCHTIARSTDRICAYFVADGIYYFAISSWAMLFFVIKEQSFSCRFRFNGYFVYLCVYAESTEITSWLISVDAINECHTRRTRARVRTQLNTQFNQLVSERCLPDFQTNDNLRTTLSDDYVARYSSVALSLSPFFPNRKFNSSQNNGFFHCNQSEIHSGLLFVQRFVITSQTAAAAL